MSDTSLLTMTAICKSFPGVKALDNVTLAVEAGEVHALVGENGAGKSTLMKILAGSYTADSGTIALRGQPVTIDNPRRAQALGISIIYQELTLLPALSIAENIFLGREPRRPLGMIHWPRLYADTAQLLSLLGIDLEPHTLINRLTIAQQQMVEIAKALSLNAELIVMDEPTSSLTERETDKLFEIIRSLKARHVTVIYISHRMEEIFALCDHVTVLRDGQVVGTRRVDEVNTAMLVQMMVGREMAATQVPLAQAIGEVVLEVKDVHRGKQLRGVNLTVRQGEIVGFAGLVGAGRTELARVIFGADQPERGEVRLQGKVVRLRSPRQAIVQGLGLVPEDRKAMGLFLGMSVRRNLVIADLARLSRFGFINQGETRRVTGKYITSLGIKTPNQEKPIRNLSGGNQQKVIIARWLAREPRLLILDEPTRGIDVGAKLEIHLLMRELADKGMAVIMVSSDLPEILQVSDRIVVMREGQIMAEFSRTEATQDKIMWYATGAHQEAHAPTGGLS